MLLYLYGLKCWQYDSWDGWALTVNSHWKIGVIYHFVVATNEIFEKLKGMAPSDLFFFFWYTIMYSQNFQLKINHYSRRVGPSGVNHWPRGFFFQSAGSQTWGAHPIKPRTSTLRPSAQPLGQPTWVPSDLFTTA